MNGFAIMHYWATRGSGQDGTILLSRRSGDEFKGMLVKADPENAKFAVQHAGFIAHMQWLRVGGTLEPAVLSLIDEIPRRHFEENMPKHVRKKLTSELNKSRRRISRDAAVIELNKPLEDFLGEDDQ
ncbi:hypothetical protein ACFVY4_31490 [Streptomyces sp. NPDC058299]|uniref:hypothetical protein n=1 Tax=Streptomyces sp. NPDC058299 TaxID=3346435 RepID=UPI0036E17B68